MKYKPIKKFKRKYLWKSVAYKKLILQRSSHLHSTGWFKSLINGYPCRNDGLEIPWMNYSVVAFLEKKLSKDFKLFEFGSGYSTYFYSRLVKTVHSVEYDSDWYAQIQKRVPENVKLTFLPKDVDEHYCRAVKLDHEKYDVVVVDGRDRVNCVIQSTDCLSEGGVILLDDSDRARYQKAFSYAEKKGFRVLEFEGLKPGKFETSMSSIIYRDSNCLGI